MIGMNGFTLGFFFPKQDFTRAAKEKPAADVNEVQQKTILKSLAAADPADQPAPLSLYAYRFF